MKSLLLVSLVFMVSGCMTFSTDELADITPQKPSTAADIEQTIGNFSFDLDGGKMVTSNKQGRSLNDEILGRWVKNGYIKSHHYVPSSKFSKNASYELTLSGYWDGHSSVILQIISGLSLMVIPNYFNHEIQVNYSLKNNTTGCSYDASIKTSYTMVQTLLFLPVFPISYIGQNSAAERAADNLYDQLNKQGAFDQNKKCQITTKENVGT